jgi:hypothetical protein
MQHNPFNTERKKKEEKGKGRLKIFPAAILTTMQQKRVRRKVQKRQTQRKEEKNNADESQMEKQKKTKQISKPQKDTSSTTSRSAGENHV